jgi:hypothetical protein
MIKEVIDSLKINFVQKATNPFFGILITIWLIKNWLLFYTLLNFDDKTDLQYKVNFIINYFAINPFYAILFKCIGLAFVTLIASFILLNITRLIVNFFDKVVTPKTYEWTDKGSVVLRTSYEEVIKVNKELEYKIESERNARLKLQTEYEQLESKYQKILFPEGSKPINENEDPISVIYNKLKSEDKTLAFKEIADSVQNKELFYQQDPKIKYFVQLGLIQPDQRMDNDWTFVLTPLGMSIYQKLLVEFNKL